MFSGFSGFLFFTFLVAVTAQGGAQCSCTGCDALPVTSGSPFTLTSAVICTNNQYAVASNIRVTSTDGSEFSVCLAVNDSSTAPCYPAGSSLQLTTCFNSTPSSLEIGGNVPTIALRISCGTTAAPCQILYGWNMTCRNFPTPAPTSPATLAPSTSTPTDNTAAACGFSGGVLVFLLLAVGF